MTTLVSWVGVDSRGPASLYIASDSRISWSGTSAHWDGGKKVFATRTSAEIFGYAGAMVFPSLLLPQICELIDCGWFGSPGEPPETRADRIEVALKSGLSAYPAPHRGSFVVLYGTREGSGMNAVLRLFSFSWSQQVGWTRTEPSLPPESGVLVAEGSGADSFNSHWVRWRNADPGRTSRAVFGAFCDSLKEGADPGSGGAPQLVRLYRARPAQVVGTVWEGARYLFGHAVPELGDPGIEWRNSLFEIVDPASLARRPDAQAQPRPRGA